MGKKFKLELDVYFTKQNVSNKRVLESTYDAVNQIRSIITQLNKEHLNENDERFDVLQDLIKYENDLSILINNIESGNDPEDYDFKYWVQYYNELEHDISILKGAYNNILI